MHELHITPAQQKLSWAALPKQDKTYDYVTLKKSFSCQIVQLLRTDPDLETAFHCSTEELRC